MAGSVGNPSFTFKVGGTNYDYQANRVEFRHMSPGGKGDRGELTWIVRGGPIPGTDPFSGKSIELLADEGSGSYRLFYGRCMDVPATTTQYGWERHYTARGLRDLADRVPVTNPTDGTDKIGFNLRFDDRDYQPALAGRTVGQIIQYTLESPATCTALTAYGIGNYNTTTGLLPTNTTDDLNNLTTILPRPFYVGGERVLQAVEGVLRDGAPNAILRVAPNGTIQIKDVRNFGVNSTTVIRLDSTTNDIVQISDLMITRSVSDCYTRVRVRGAPQVVGVWLSTAAGTLLEKFDHDGLNNAQAKAAWRAWDFVLPGQQTGAATFLATINAANKVTGVAIMTPGYGYNTNTNLPLTFTGGGGSGAAGNFATDSYGQATTPVTLTNNGTNYTTAPQVTGPIRSGSGQTDSGTCNCPDTTHVTVTSSDNTKHWPANFWDQTSNGRHGVIYLNASIVSGINSLFSAQITANAQLNAAGNCSITIDRAMPSTSFDSYTIYGTAGGAANVWRRYKPADNTVTNSLTTFFPFPVPMTSTDGTMSELVSRPSMQVLYHPTNYANSAAAMVPMGMTVDTTTGYFYADRPVVSVFGTPTNLQAGGSNTDGIPTDVRIFAAVRTGNLQAVKPADTNGNATFSGTAYTVDGINETLTITMSDWIDQGNQSNMDAYAQDLLESVQDAVYEGAIPLVGYRSSYLTNFGLGVQISGPVGRYTLPWENNVTFPVVRTALEWCNQGPRYRTVLYVSTRRAAFTSEIYRRIPPVQGIWWGADLTQAEFKFGDIGTMKYISDERMPGVRFGNAQVLKLNPSGGNT